MTRLDPHSGRTLFAPLVYRLALRMEQATWSDVTESAAEAVHVLRSAQRLFKTDVLCASFDTWLEAEAAGLVVARDDMGLPTGKVAPASELPPVDSIMSAEPVTRVVEVVRRLASEGGSALPIATITAGATLLSRLGGAATRERVLGRGEGEALDPEDAGLVDHVQQIMIALARAYCEAGAAALVLLDEEPSGDFGELSLFTALFNLADYFATPVFILSRGPCSPAGLGRVASAGVHGLTPDATTDGVAALPAHGAVSGWIAMSRWEVDPDTDPNDVQAWRRTLAA